MSTEILKTATQVALVDPGLTSWELFAGEDINLRFEFGTNLDREGIEYWNYRGQAAMCQRATDDAIVRVRIGTPGDVTDKQIYRQIITDPTSVTQWETWNLLYTGDWDAVAIQRDPDAVAGYVVYHFLGAELPSYGYIRVDNVASSFAIPPGDKITKIRPVVNKPGALWYCYLSAHSVDNKISLIWRYIPDITQVVVLGFIYQGLNHSFEYATTSSEIFSVISGPNHYRFWSLPFGQNPRDISKSDALVLDLGPATDVPGTETTRYRLLHASERAGRTVIKDCFYTESISSTYKYLFFTSYQLGENDEILHNLESPLFYSQTIDPTQGITEPTPTGFSLWGFCGVVSVGGYTYAMGNGAVWRRNNTTTTTEISDYFISGELDIQGENQKSTAKLVFANPDNAVGALIGYNPTSNTDNTICTGIGSQVRVRLGQKLPDDAGYTFGEPALWWLTKVNRISSEKQRIELTCEDFWNRLEIPYIHGFYYPGEVVSRDWVADGDNSVNNFFVAESTRAITRAVGPNDLYPWKMKIPRNKWVLDTRWRMFDGSITARFLKNSDQLAVIAFRYIDPNNLHYVRVNSSGSVDLGCKFKGRKVERSIGVATGFPDTDFTIKVDFRGDYYKVWVNSEDVSPSNLWNWMGDCNAAKVISMPRTGFCGVRVGSTTGGVSYMVNWQIDSFEEPMTTATVIQKALAHAGFLKSDFDPSLSDTEQIEVIMGPQTDLPDPAKVLEKFQDNTALQTVWLPNLTPVSRED